MLHIAITAKIIFWALLTGSFTVSGNQSTSGNTNRANHLECPPERPKTATESGIYCGIQATVAWREEQPKQVDIYYGNSCKPLLAVAMYRANAVLVQNVFD